MACDCKIPVITLILFDWSFKFCPICGKPLAEKEWEPETGKSYWYVSADGSVSQIYIPQGVFSALPETTKRLHAFGNLFTSQAAAEKHRDMIRCVDSERELPEKNADIWRISSDGTILQGRSDRMLCNVLWKLGFAQPCTDEGKVLLYKNINKHKAWFE
jgi:hypothetical protein